MKAAALIATAALASAPAALAEEPPTTPPAGEASPTTRELLSKPGEVSRWAFVLRKAIVRKQPVPGAEAVTRLRLKTQDGTDEIVMVLERFIDDSGRRWVRVRLPILPNNTTGWVPQEALGGFHRVRTWLRIDTKRFKATLIRSGRVVFRARVGVGKKQWPTPKGEFFVRDRLEGFPPDGMYGPLAFGLNARSAVLTDWPGGGFVGVHGTNEPNLLPGRVSHGCIRLRNTDIKRLGRLMPVGTPVTVT